MAKKKEEKTDNTLLQRIASEYDDRCRTYGEFTITVKRLVEDLLHTANIRVHSVTSRVKSIDSINEKVKNSTDEKYQELDDISDVSGIRIITFFADEVDATAKLITKEFSINNKLSVDKRSLLDPDRFGYLSLHYIAKFPPRRIRLTEYKRFKDCQVEIQIRSILQHTWAEIEHDLGYKTKLSVPTNIRRRFSQLAGLLELADDTFAQIRDYLTEYEKDVYRQIIEIPDVVQIDKASLSAFCARSEIVEQLDNEIASYFNGGIGKEPNEEFITSQVSRLYYININTIGELIRRYTDHKNDIFALAAKYLTKRHSETETKVHLPTFIKGVSLLYLIYQFLCEKSHDTESLSYEMTQIGLGKKHAYQVAAKMLND